MDNSTNSDNKSIQVLIPKLGQYHRISYILQNETKYDEKTQNDH